MRVIDTGKYLLGNLAMSYMLEKEQKILDRNLTLLSQRKTVFEQLKIWGLHGEYGPMAWTVEMVPNVDDSFAKTIEEVSLENNIKIRYFLKINQAVRKKIEHSIQKQQKALSSFKGSFEKYL